MRTVRLLPVLVVAISAVLVLKTTGLVTHGSYVLGVSSVQAEDHAAPAAGAAEAGGDATITFPAEPTIADTSPELADSQPTVGQDPAAAGHGAPAAEGEHGAAVPADGAAAPLPPVAPPSIVDMLTACAASVTAPAAGAAAAEGHGAAAPAGASPGSATPADGEPLTGMTIDPNCLPADAVPTRMGIDGTMVPVVSPETSGTEAILLERLATRRDELNTYEEQLALREALVDAAEQRIQERTTTLEALEAQISALVDQRSAMESEQFANVVAMYSTMKPKDAALIFDTLEMDVLLRVAKTMSARKMAPIMALMSPARAQELTVALSTIVTDPPEDMKPDELAALPQIVGQ